MDATAVDRRDEAAARSGLAVGEWAVVGAAGILLLSLTTFDWFAFSDREQVVVGSEGDAFRWLDGPEYLLLVAGLVAGAAPLLRLIGVVSVAPRDVALGTGSAGLVAAVVVIGLIASPPELDRGMLNVPVGGGPTAETIVRGGAAVGLIAALGIVALSVLTIVASPAALTPVHRPRAPAPVPKPVAKPKPKPAVAAPKPKPRPKPKPKPKPAKRTRTTRPKPPTQPRSAPKAPARPSLAIAAVEDLVGVGFTPAQAQRIVEYRDELGKVTKLSDLRRVPGIAKPVLAELVKRLDD